MCIIIRTTLANGPKLTSEEYIVLHSNTSVPSTEMFNN